MSVNWVTLTASGRLPGALGITPSAGNGIYINSGVVGVMPHATSGFSCYMISCLGLDTKYVSASAMSTRGPRGSLGVPFSGEPSGTILFNGTISGGSLKTCLCRMERKSGVGSSSLISVVGGGGYNTK